ncbi:hypothetical protein JL720_12087 [Aureococcus anophagefferens]|nr:hypothetical protein JL720_12087 [Aureococcus anophagefferens]
MKCFSLSWATAPLLRGATKHHVGRGRAVREQRSQRRRDADAHRAPLLRALTKSAHIYEQLRHDDWVERRAGAAAVGDMDVGWEAAALLPVVARLARADVGARRRKDDADRDVRSKAAEVIDRTKDDYVRLTAKRDGP